MKPYVVQQGDYLDKIARLRGLSPDEVWSHPDNAGLAASRDRNVLHPGDCLWLPDVDVPGLDLACGTTNRYAATVARATLRLRFEDAQGAIANAAYEVKGLGGDVVRGSSAGDGLVELDVPVHVREVEIVFVDRGRTFRVRVGEMDPVTEDSGVMKRLRHLGYDEPQYSVPLTPDAEKERMEEAVAVFQHEHGLEPTGQVDDATRAALIEAHGS